MTTLMDIVIGCSNTLGWEPDIQPGQHYWEAFSLEVHKLRKAIDSERRIPKRQATLTNLALALEYSRRRQLPVTSPVALLHRIPDALALAYTPTPLSSLDTDIRAAISWERGQDDPDSLRWIHRLTRATGPARQDVLHDWKAAGRG